MKCYQTHRRRLKAIFEKIHRRIRRYPPSLRQLGREWWGTLGTDPYGYPSAPDAPPLLHLPIWMAEGHGSKVSAGALDAILESTALLYFHTRIQDNVLDEPLTRGRAPHLLLGNMFFLEAWERLRSLPLSDRFWSWTNEAWRIFSDETEAERRQLQRPTRYSPALFRRHARKVALARIPLYAVMDGSDGDSLAEKTAIDGFIDRLGQAYGLVNDVLGVERDLSAGLRTYLVATVEASLPRRRRRDPAELRRGLLSRPHLERFLEQAIALHRRIHRLGEALGVARMGVYTDERIQRLRHHQNRALELRLRFALSGKAWSDVGKAARDLIPSNEY